MAAAPPRSTPPVAARHNLPAARTDCIGRERERVAAAQALSDARLVTLTGVGGGGKTRLALAIAADLTGNYPDGVWLIELAPLNDPALVPEAIAAALDLVPTRNADPAADLLAYLRPRKLLLVLDNCEHLVGACAAFAARALIAAPGLGILATSHEPLRVPGERQQRLAPLATPNPASLPPIADLAHIPAVRLFVERAEAADPEFRLAGANAAAVAGICARLDGLPLALELAAARVGVLGLAQILERLNDSVRLLTGGNRAGPTRQQTLRATLAWGEALLTPEERSLFRRLAVFAGGWDLEAAEAVGAGDDLDPLDVLDLLAQLVDKSLVLAETGTRQARYRLLEPVRQFAAAQLAAHGERDAARARHAAHYLALAERAAPALRGPEQVRWQGRLAGDLGNLRAALAWTTERAEHGDPEPGLRLATALVPFWETRSDLPEGRTRMAAALAASPPGTVEPALRVRALIGAGRLAYLLSAYADAAALQEEALAGGHALGDSRLIATAQCDLGTTERTQRDDSGAARHLEEALARFRALGDRAGMAHSLLNLGATARGAGEFQRANTLHAESLALFEGEGDLRMIAIARSMLGRAATQAGEHARASTLLATALAAHPDLGNRGFVIWNLMGLAQALFAQGRRGEAARLLGAAEVVGELAGAELTRAGQVSYEQFLGEAEACRGEAPFAAAWAEGRAMPLDRVVAYALALAGAAPSADEPPRAAAPTEPARSAPALAAPIGEALTRREREVALLVAQGHSDRKIAASLSISPATTGTHVHNILAKLDLRSRHQVAEWVVAQGLLPPSE